MTISLSCWLSITRRPGRPQGTGVAPQAWLESMLAEACMQCNRVEDGLAAISRAEHLVEKYGVHDRLSEMLRIKAGLMHVAVPGDRGAVETCLREAIAIARHQQAKSIELGRTVDLARLLIGSGQRREAQDQLTPIYTWFTEGFDTWHLEQAKGVMEGLR